MLKLNLLGMFWEISSEKLLNDITKVFPQHVFSNMVGTYIIVKTAPSDIKFEGQGILGLVWGLPVPTF